jgi:2-(1,2-epoxy-1,2-dihydrophenyl)acetyl-CoA isomerase
VAAESAYLLLAFVNIGLVPDGGSSLFVPARIGFARATEMAMLGERIPAPKALEWGPRQPRGWPTRPSGRGGGVCATASPRADALLRRDQRQLNHLAYARLEQQLAARGGHQQEMAGSPDFAEGVAAFVQKRRRRSKGW